MTQSSRWMKNGGAALVALGIGVSAAFAQNTVLVEDDFEGVAVGADPDNTIWTTQGGNAFKAVADNATNPFGSPNQYLDWNDNASASSSVRLQSANFTEIEGVVTTFAFDFVEPSASGNGQFLFGYSIAGGDLNTAGQHLRLRLDDGTVSSQQGFNETGTTSYDLDRAYRVYVLVNDTAVDVVSYFNGETLDAGDADIWLQPVGEGPIFVAASDRVDNAPARVGFRTFNSTVQRMYLDNVLLETGLGGPFGQSLAPGIAIPPQSQEVVLGTTQAIFQVVASGTPPLSFQWQKNGAPLTGETSNTLAIDNPRIADEGAYSVVVSNDLGTATSDPGTLSLVAAPIEPPVQVALDGATVSFSVAMPVDSVGYQYQWRRDGGNLAGETNETIVIAGATSTASGMYSMSVSLDGDTVVSGEAQLLVAPPASAAYSTTVLANGPVAYWRLGEMSGSATAADIAGAAGGPFNGSYGPAVILEQGGAILGDGDAAAGFLGTETSKVEVAFAEQLNPAGAFSVEAWALVEGGQGSERNVVTSFDPTQFPGVEAYGYALTASSQNQWRFTTGRGFPGAGPVQTDLDGPTVIPLEWTHLVGTYDGSTFTFYVNGAPWASVTETFEPVDPFFAVPLFIGAGGVEDSTGAGNSFFDGLIDEVAFYGAALTQQQVLEHFAAGLPTEAEPRITVQPNHEQRDISGQVTFAVGVRSGGEPAFQWQKDGSDIAGASTDTLALTNLQAADAGDYRVLVTVGANVVTSEVATLTLRPPSTVLIDDFDTYVTGLVENVASPAWIVNLNGYYRIEEETPGGNKFLRALDNDGSGTAPTLVSFGDTNVTATATNAVPDKGISTIFLRFYLEETVDGSLWFGATDSQTGGFNAFEGYVNTTLPTGFTIRDGGVFFPAVSNLVLGSWYNLWQVQDNDTDTIQVYLTTENRDATLTDRLEDNGRFAFGFRNGTGDPLTYFQLISRAMTGGHRVDDMYISTGINLTNPVAVPSLGPVGISLQGGTPEITWTDPGTLQRTEDLAGLWSDITNAVSPFALSGDAAAEHYRLRQ